MNSPKISGLQKSITALLSELGEDVDRNGLEETPGRFEKQIRESLVGYKDDPKNHVKLFESNDFHDLIVVSKISFSSLCEHHLLPFYGYVDIGYVPTDKILGLSKFARVIDSISRRLQVQERLTRELAEFLYEHLNPELLMVRIIATHSCMTIRGVRRPESATETVSMLGNVEENNRHVEHFRSIPRKEM